MAESDVFENLDVAEETATAEPETAIAAGAAAEPAKEPAKGEASKESAKQAEPAKEPAKAEKPDPRDWVPVSTFLETKNELKALRERLSVLESPPKAKPAEPDFTQDPKGYVDTRVSAVLEQLETGIKPVKQSAEQAEAAANETRFMHALATAEQSFVATTPDYFDALQHIRSLREAELTTLHPDVPITQIRAFMSQEELQLAANLMRSNRNPSEVAYTLAKARGYTPKQAKAAAEVAQLVPNVPEPKKLPPDQTLGTGAGSPGAGDEQDEADSFDLAMNAVFGRKRA